ncbi:hypothetical protein ACT4Y7_13615 [Acinetobacter baumannii]
MSTNHQLKNCLFEFLSNRTFSGYEFKDLRMLFITNYPEFSSKKYYAKIYNVIRELASLALILIDMRTCTYKYTSNYERANLHYLIQVESIEQILVSLKKEYEKVQNEIMEAKNRVSIYQKYLARFPILSEVISQKIEEMTLNLNLLYSEKKALETLIDEI